MDFSVLGFKGGGAAAVEGVGEVNKNKWYGSTSLKQERTLEKSQDDWKDPKIAKTSDYFSASKETRYHTDNILFKDHQHQQMLSFSDNNSQMLSFPHYSSNAHSRIPGYVSEGMNAGIMHGMLTGMKGPFTPLQWMELEQQALIYKYITLNIPIPLPLLISIQKNLDNAAFSNYPGFRYNTLGWGGLNLGFSSRNDPDPGRCRRTDGKKWRCAKDAVVNHKYCERHMNRGRHRSRKLVEAGDKSGQSIQGNANGTSKLPFSSTISAATPENSSANNSSFMNQGVADLQPFRAKSSPVSHQGYARSQQNKSNVSVRAEDTCNVSGLPPTMSLNHLYSSTEHQNGIEGTRAEFGLTFSNSSLNRLSKNASQIHGNIVPFEAGNNSDNNKLQHSLHLFGDDWTTNRPESSISDKTELSISIPKTPSDYMSTTSSPNNDKFGTFPLRLLPELEATHMGLGIGTADEHIPGSWKTTVGGPLGEALHITTNGNGDGKGSSALNLMTGGWGSNSPPMASSPTGVLQKAVFGSVSNSSARSSPESSRGGSICFNGLFGSTHLNSVFPGL